jgi:hypothetical protein
MGFPDGNQHRSRWTCGHRFPRIVEDDDIRPERFHVLVGGYFEGDLLIRYVT